MLPPPGTWYEGEWAPDPDGSLPDGSYVDWTIGLLLPLIGGPVPRSRRLARAAGTWSDRRLAAALQAAGLAPLDRSGERTAWASSVSTAQVLAAILADLEAEAGGDPTDLLPPTDLLLSGGSSPTPTSGAPPGHAREAHPRPRRVTAALCRTSSRREAGHAAAASLSVGPPEPGGSSV